MAVRVPEGAWTFTPESQPVAPGCFLGRTHRRTFRIQGSRDWLLIYTLAGSGLYRFNGGEYESRPHEITLYRPGVFQDYQWSPRAGKWDLLYAHFLPRDEWQTWLNWPRVGEDLMVLRIGSPSLRRRMVARLRDMIRIYRGSQVRRQAMGLNALEEVLLWCDSINPQQASARVDERVRRVMESLCQQPAAPFSDERLARLAGLSASRLRHLFRLQAGKSMRDFQEQQRLERARQLLSLSSQTIGEIAAELGFANPFYFTLRFKKYAGESPRAFRDRIRRENG
jgi:AraC family transcriptional regulator of arabinose operon